MGLWEFLQQWPRARTVAGLAASLVLHVTVIAGVLWGWAPGVTPKWTTRPGDTLLVELPRPDEPAPGGTPSAPSRPAPPARAEARPAAPAPRREVSPPPADRRVASAPRAPETPPTPRAPERETPVAQAASEPSPRAATVTPPVPEPPPAVPEPAPVDAAPAPVAPPPAAPAAQPVPSTPPPAPAVVDPAPVEPRRDGGERRIASLPPARAERPSVSDVRAALRGGVGGLGQARGGIKGDPIPLDSPDARYSDYLEQVKRKIKQHWGFPCVRNPQTRTCEHYTTSLDVQFGILRDGRVQFVDVVRVADHAIYDDYAVNAIKLASPFPPVPPEMMRAMPAGSTGLPISARFSYVVESSLTNLLR
jgi:hypothetical protein